MSFDFKKYSPALILLILLIIPFTAYFYRPDFTGWDPYGFLLLTCQANNAAGITGIPYAIFTFLPCNFIILKAVLFLLAFISGYYIIKLSQLFSPKHGWRASYLIFLSSVYVLEFAKLENEAFAFTLLFASAYYFFKGIKKTKNSRTNSATAFALLIIAGLIWRGSIFYLIGYLLNITILLIALLPFLVIHFEENFLHWKTLFGAAIGTNVISEDMPFKFHRHFALHPGLVGAILDPILAYQTILYFVLGTLSSKYWILSLPFLVVGLVLVHERLANAIQFESKHSTFIDKVLQKAINFFEQNHAQIFAAIAIFTTIAVTQSILLGQPTQDNWDGIEFALSLDKNISNSWDLGYWIMWQGGTTENYQSPAKQTQFFPGQIAIIREDNNCTTLKNFKDVNVVRC